MAKQCVNADWIKRSLVASGKVILALSLLLATLMATSRSHAYESSSPILGSIADDLMALGDLQYGPTPFILQNEDSNPYQVRHQRTTLEGGEVFCTQFPTKSQVRVFGMQITRYSANFSTTICDLAGESSQAVQKTAVELYREKLANQSSSQEQAEQATPELEPVSNDVEASLAGQTLRTERSYCLANYEAREFFVPPSDESWLREGQLTTYDSEMFVGFRVLKDPESGTIFALSDVLNEVTAQQVGCSSWQPRIIVKMSVVQDALEQTETP